MNRFEHRLTRRDAARILGLSAVALTPGLRPAGADAQIRVCRRDPIFSLDGKTGHIYLSCPEETRLSNNSSTDVVIHHPFKCATKLIWVDPEGFGTGQGISCNFREATQTATYPRKTSQGYEIEIRVKVPMNRNDVPIWVEFAPAPGVNVTHETEGRPNEWITLRALLP